MYFKFIESIELIYPQGPLKFPPCHCRPVRPWIKPMIMIYVCICSSVHWPLGVCFPCGTKPVQIFSYQLLLETTNWWCCLGVRLFSRVNAGTWGIQGIVFDDLLFCILLLFFSSLSLLDICDVLQHVFWMKMLVPVHIARQGEKV